jgi:hypothetical protein
LKVHLPYHESISALIIKRHDPDSLEGCPGRLISSVSGRVLLSRSKRRRHSVGLSDVRRPPR